MWKSCKPSCDFAVGPAGATDILCNRPARPGFGGHFFVFAEHRLPVSP